jgi:hypothetical protein
MVPRQQRSLYFWLSDESAGQAGRGVLRSALISLQRKHFETKPRQPKQPIPLLYFSSNLFRYQPQQPDKHTLIKTEQDA